MIRFLLFAVAYAATFSTVHTSDPYGAGSVKFVFPPLPAPAIAYIVMRSTNGGEYLFESEIYAIPNSTAPLSIIDPDIKAGNTYKYEVVALDSQMNLSPPSASTSITIPSALPLPASPKTLSITVN